MQMHTLADDLTPFREDEGRPAFLILASRAAGELLIAGAERKSFRPGEMLSESSAWLIESGMADEVLTDIGGRSAGTRCVGPGSLLGWPLPLQDQRSVHCLTDVKAIPFTTTMAKEFGASSALARLGFLDTQRMVHDISCNLVAAANLRTEFRLARWLSQSFDMIDVPQLNITHDRLARILGVRRASVTSALHILEGERAIRNERARILVLDRRRLSELAFPTCYAKH
jgi:CRP-like cAMP-binding protein